MKRTLGGEQLQAAQLEVLKDMFIAQLGLAGVPQLEIAKIVRVVRIFLRNNRGS